MHARVSENPDLSPRQSEAQSDTETVNSENGNLDMWLAQVKVALSRRGQKRTTVSQSEFRDILDDLGVFGDFFASGQCG